MMRGLTEITKEIVAAFKIAKPNCRTMQETNLTETGTENYDKVEM